MEENRTEDVTIETVDNGDGTLTTTITEPVAVELPDYLQPVEEPTEDESDAKLGLAVAGLGVAAVIGIGAAIRRKVKNKKKADTKEAPAQEEKKGKEPRELKKVVEGRKLSLAERLKGVELVPVEPAEKAENAEDEA